MVKLFSIIRLSLLINNLSKKPEDTSRVFAIVDFLISRYPKKSIDKAELTLRSNPNFVQFYERYKDDEILTNTISLAHLQTLNTNTFGYRFAEFMYKNELSTSFFTPTIEDNLLKVVRNRLAKTHDIFHFLTNFGTSPENEFGLQAFYLGQEPSMAAFCIMLAGFLRVIKSLSVKEIPTLMNAISKGYINGTNSSSMLYIIWEDLWELDYDEVIKSLNIHRFH